MSVRMRHTRGHTKNRRSHHFLKEPCLATCGKCGEKHLYHRACLSCGTYKGKEVRVSAKTRTKKDEKKA
ncbi:MAG: 50S ribosomal protein L32 [Candidatus Paceibacterota bacterium]